MLMYIALCAAADLSVAVEEMATYLINSFGQRDEDEIGKFILLFLFWRAVFIKQRPAFLHNPYTT